MTGSSVTVPCIFEKADRPGGIGKGIMHRLLQMDTILFGIGLFGVQLRQLPEYMTGRITTASWNWRKSTD